MAGEGQELEMRGEGEEVGDEGVEKTEEKEVVYSYKDYVKAQGLGGCWGAPPFESRRVSEGTLALLSGEYPVEEVERVPVRGDGLPRRRGLMAGNRPNRVMRV